MSQPSPAIAWTLDPNMLLVLRTVEHTINSQMAHRLHLRLSPDETGLRLTLRTEHFHTIHATAIPTDGIWLLHWAAVLAFEEHALADEIAMLSPSDIARITPEMDGPRLTDPKSAAENVLRRIALRLEAIQRESTFAPLIAAFANTTIISANLQPRFRHITGMMGTRRFEIELGRVNPEDKARVTLYPPGPAAPARAKQIHTIQLNEDLVRLDAPHLAETLIKTALSLEAPMV